MLHFGGWWSFSWDTILQTVVLKWLENRGKVKKTGRNSRNQGDLLVTQPDIWRQKTNSGKITEQAKEKFHPVGRIFHFLLF